MSATMTLLRTELTLLRRDTTAWATATVFPLLIGAMWVISEPNVGEGLGAAIVFQVIGLLIFSLHTVGTMALASRREQLVLKRWRSSEASSTSVLAGTIGIPAALVVIQAVVLTLITAAVYDQRPASVAMLSVGVLALPGGGVIQLLRLGWDGPAGTGSIAWFTEVAPSLLATVVVTALATAGAVRWFRWEPRR